MVKTFLKITTCIALMSAIHGIVPRPGTPLKAHEDAGKRRKNVGRLITYKDDGSVGTCTVTLIGQSSGGVGIALTAAHCVNGYSKAAEEGRIPKCPVQEVSFAAEHTDEDPHKVPVIGTHAFSRFINNTELFRGDLAVVYLDLSQHPGLSNIKVDDAFSEDDLDIPLAEVVGYGLTKLFLKTNKPEEKDISETQLGRTLEVVGYGQKHFLDGDSTVRRSMATSATLQQIGHKGNSETDLMMLLDSSETVSMPGYPPVGKSPAQGDSGGPVIDLSKEHIVGVVSFATTDSGKSLVYALPVQPYLDWIDDQLKQLEGMVVTPTETTALMSNPQHWSTPGALGFCGYYGEMHKVAKLETPGQKVVADTHLTPYTVVLNADNTTLSTKGGGRKVSILDCRGKNTSLTAKDAASTLTTNVMNVSAPTQIGVPLHVERTLAITKTVLDSKKKLRVSDGGVIHIGKSSTVRTPRVIFDQHIVPSMKDHQQKIDQGQTRFLVSEIPQPGVIHLEGELTSADPINHSAHTILVGTSSPGVINGSYGLNSYGRLKIDLKNRRFRDDTPLLRVNGTARISGTLEFDYDEPLKEGDSLTIVQADNLYLPGRTTKERSGTLTVYNFTRVFRKDIPLTKPGTKLEIDVEDPSKLKFKVVRTAGPALGMGNCQAEDPLELQ